jgi:hypothetical protein
MQVTISVTLDIRQAAPGDVKTIAVDQLDRALRRISNDKREDSGVTSYKIHFPK